MLSIVGLFHLYSLPGTLDIHYALILDIVLAYLQHKTSPEGGFARPYAL